MLSKFESSCKETNEAFEKAGRGPVHGDGFDGPLIVDNDMEDKITHTNADKRVSGDSVTRTIKDLHAQFLSWS